MTAVVFTARQAEVADAMARGLSYGEIAAELHITPSSVRTHVMVIYRKLDIPGDRGAFLHAYQRTRIPCAATRMRERTGKLSEAAWIGLITMMLDALDEA